LFQAHPSNLSKEFPLLKNKFTAKHETCAYSELGNGNANPGGGITGFHPTVGFKRNQAHVSMRRGETPSLILKN